VPYDLWEVVGRKENTESLITRDLREAVVRFEVRFRAIYGRLILYDDGK